MNEGNVERHLKGCRVFITYGKSTEIDRKELIDESRMLETMEENYRERNNSLLKMTLVTCFFFVLHFKFVGITGAFYKQCKLSFPHTFFLHREVIVLNLWHS